MAEQLDPNHRRPERLLFDLAQRLSQSSGYDYHALFCNLSALRPYHRDAGHRRLAERILKPLAENYAGEVLRLFTGDLVLLAEALPPPSRDEAVERLFRLFANDPLVNDGEKKHRFVRIFDLRKDAEAFKRFAAHLVEARAKHDEALKNISRVKRPESVPQKPLDAKGLVKVETALQTSDVEGMIARQPVCLIDPDGNPRPTFDEIYIAVHRLQSQILPNCDMQANPWLFQNLTKLLDQRLLASLIRSGDASLKNAFSLNLNVSTLTSERFLNFDAVHGQGRNESILVELQLIDVMANFSDFQLTRNFLADHRYRLCLDGVGYNTLSSLHAPRELGFDFIKLRWSPDIVDLWRANRLDPLRRAIAGIGAERVVMTQCDTQDAIDIGLEIGMKLFQGYHVDAKRAGELNVASPTSLAKAV
jgi:EAL domain-containing protein (putative c-di-GMP-specific phosphodiesterase class I)